MRGFESPRLLADLGAAYLRLALEVAPGRFEHAASLRCADHPGFDAAVSRYLADIPAGTQPVHAAVAVANPVAGDEVRMTNSPWAFSIEATRTRLGLDTLVVVNDYTALAMGVPRLAPGERRQVGGGTAQPGSVIGVIGPGTGLGVSGLVPAREGWVALATEGGHASFAPRDERELDVLRQVWKAHPHASFERLLSASGLTLIHTALAERAGVAAAPVEAPEITRRALEAGDALCREAVALFCAALGTAASNLAVTLGARGGIYIGGNIVPRLGEWFDRSPFRERFESRGRFSGYVRAVPTFVITGADATMKGISAILDAQLRALGRERGATALAQVRRILPELSAAERRVAEHVLARPRQALADPVAGIAQAAGVSQPTVIRFCRSLGFEGLPKFKLHLAASLTGTLPVSHAQVTHDDSSLELGAKVFDNTASAILQFRERIPRASVDRALDLLDRAARVECQASGPYSIVAQDAQYKLLRLGLACSAVTDPRLLRLSARALREGDVALIASGSGRVPELVEAAAGARAQGASVIAITTRASPLAEKADVALIVEHDESLPAQLPMVSRILHLLVIDTLAVGLAMRRSVDPASLAQDGEDALPAVLQALFSHSDPRGPDSTR